MTGIGRSDSNLIAGSNPTAPNLDSLDQDLELEVPRERLLEMEVSQLLRSCLRY